MTTDHKEQIVKQLNDRMVTQGISQEKVARMIGGTSGATINQMLSGKWKVKDQLISIEMWTRVESWLTVNKDWITVTTDPTYKKIYNICHFSQKHSQSKAIIGVPGTGKSNTLRDYAANNGNVYYLECAEYWTRKVFLNKLKKAMGLAIELGSVHELVESITEHLRKTQAPLIIIDEADKLKDPVLNFFNCFYNETLHSCGFILAGAPFLEQRIHKGVRLNKQSYRELFSRIGGEFKGVKAANEISIANICKANGVTSEMDIQRITTICKSGDLRTVKNEVDNFKLQQSKTTIRNEN